MKKLIRFIFLAFVSSFLCGCLSTNTTVIPEGIKTSKKYDYVSTVLLEGFAKTRLGDKWGFVDISGNEVVPVKYDEAYEFFEGLAPVRLGNKWGFVNGKGELVIDLMYDKVYQFSAGLVPVKLNGKWGYIDKKGITKIPFKYDHANPFSRCLAPVNIKNKWGYINTKGKVVIPIKYDDASWFRNGYGMVYVGHRALSIDKQGNLIKNHIASLGSIINSLKIEDEKCED